MVQRVVLFEPSSVAVSPSRTEPSTTGIPTDRTSELFSGYASGGDGIFSLTVPAHRLAEPGPLFLGVRCERFCSSHPVSLSLSLLLRSILRCTKVTTRFACFFRCEATARDVAFRAVAMRIDSELTLGERRHGEVIEPRVWFCVPLLAVCTWEPRCLWFVPWMGVAA
jgi:hypothetical protein